MIIRTEGARVPHGALTGIDRGEADVESSPAGHRWRRAAGAVLGVALIAAAVTGYGRLAVANRDVAPTGRYGELWLDRAGYSSVMLMAIGLVVLAVTGVMLVLPARAALRLVLAACAGLLLCLGLFTYDPVQFSSGAVFGEGCIPARTMADARELMAGRQTVGAKLTFGLVQGDVLDDPVLREIIQRDPDVIGCEG